MSQKLSQIELTPAKLDLGKKNLTQVIQIPSFDALYYIFTNFFLPRIFDLNWVQTCREGILDKACTTA